MSMAVKEAQQLVSASKVLILLSGMCLFQQKGKVAQYWVTAPQAVIHTRAKVYKLIIGLVLCRCVP